MASTSDEQQNVLFIQWPLISGLFVPYSAQDK